MESANTLSSLPTKGGMRREAIKPTTLWKSVSRERIRQGRFGIGMLCF